MIRRAAVARVALRAVPVHPGFRATVDRHGNLLIERDAA